MKTQQVLFFCFFSALTRPVSAKFNIYTGAEGGNGSINCHVTLTGNRKFFCRNTCAAEDILIKTDGTSAQSGRYSLSYKPESSTRGILSVAITGLTWADSGRYRCGLGSALAPESYSEFDVRVSNEPFLNRAVFIHTDISGENITVPCSPTVYGKHKFFCKGKCEKPQDILVETDGSRDQNGRYVVEYREGSIFGLYTTITQLSVSDTGPYRCGYGTALSPDSFRDFSIVVVDVKPDSTSASEPAATTPTTRSAVFRNMEQPTATRRSEYFLPLVVCVSLAGVLLIAVFLLLSYIRKMKRNLSSNSFSMLPTLYSNPSPDT